MQKTRLVAINENGRRIGEDHPNAKLTNEDVELIRDLHETEGLSYSALAHKFDVAKSTIQDIVKNRRRAQTLVGWKAVRMTLLHR